MKAIKILFWYSSMEKVAGHTKLAESTGYLWSHGYDTRTYIVQFLVVQFLAKNFSCIFLVPCYLYTVRTLPLHVATVEATEKQQLQENAISAKKTGGRDRPASGAQQQREGSCNCSFSWQSIIVTAGP